MDTSPITVDFGLACGAEHAFAVYAGAAWWPARYTANPATFVSLSIAPTVGGPVVERHTNAEYTWGEVLVWEPGRRLAYSVTLAQRSSVPSVIGVEFLPREAGGCDLRFTHGGWVEANAADRAKFTDWPGILDRFAEATGS